MKPEDRIVRWLEELEATLCIADELAARGVDEYENDPAMPLAFESLANRVGDLAKKLVAAEPDRFSDATWRAAARTHDFVVHHYDRIDSDLLWRTVTVSFPTLRKLMDEQRGTA